MALLFLRGRRGRVLHLVRLEKADGTSRFGARGAGSWEAYGLLRGRVALRRIALRRIATLRRVSLLLVIPRHPCQLPKCPPSPSHGQQPQNSRLRHVELRYVLREEKGACRDVKERCENEGFGKGAGGFEGIKAAGLEGAWSGCLAKADAVPGFFFLRGDRGNETGRAPRRRYHEANGGGWELFEGGHE